MGQFNKITKIEPDLKAYTAIMVLALFGFFACTSSTYIIPDARQPKVKNPSYTTKPEHGRLFVFLTSNDLSATDQKFTTTKDIEIEVRELQVQTIDGRWISVKKYDSFRRNVLNLKGDQGIQLGWGEFPMGGYKALKVKLADYYWQKIRKSNLPSSLNSVAALKSVFSEVSDIGSHYQVKARYKTKPEIVVPFQFELEDASKTRLTLLLDLKNSFSDSTQYSFASDYLWNRLFVPKIDLIGLGQDMDVYGPTSLITMVPGEICVRLRKDMSSTEAVELIADIKAAGGKPVSIIARTGTLLLQFTRTTPYNTMAALMEDFDEVQSYEPNYHNKIFAEESETLAMGYVHPDMELVRSLGLGDHEPKVAVIDTGVDQSHSALGADRIGNISFQTTGPGEAFDGSNHGTAVAGIIAANDEPEGIISYNPNTRLYSYKLIPPNGEADFFMLANAVYTAVDMDMDIINMSVGGYGESPMLDEAINYAVNKGVILVASAGNDGVTTPIYPAAYPEVIGVGSVDSSNRVSDFSNFGQSADIFAPGEMIKSTADGGSYSNYYGTSFAAPQVTGLGSLLLSHFPNMNKAEFLELLRETAAIIPNQARTYVDVDGDEIDDLFGYGALDPYRAMATKLGKSFADLSVVTILDVSYAASEQSGFKVLIQNTGTSHYGGGQLQIDYYGEIATASAPTLAPGATADVFIEWQPTSNGSEIFVEVAAVGSDTRNWNSGFGKTIPFSESTVADLAIEKLQLTAVMNQSTIVEINGTALITNRGQTIINDGQLLLQSQDLDTESTESLAITGFQTFADIDIPVLKPGETFLYEFKKPVIVKSFLNDGFSIPVLAAVSTSQPDANSSNNRVIRGQTVKFMGGNTVSALHNPHIHSYFADLSLRIVKDTYLPEKRVRCGSDQDCVNGVDYFEDELKKFGFLIPFGAYSEDYGDVMYHVGYGGDSVIGNIAESDGEDTEDGRARLQSCVDRSFPWYPVGCGDSLNHQLDHNAGGATTHFWNSNGGDFTAGLKADPDVAPETPIYYKNVGERVPNSWTKVLNYWTGRNWQNDLQPLYGFRGIPQLYHHKGSEFAYEINGVTANIKVYGKEKPLKQTDRKWLDSNGLVIADLSSVNVPGSQEIDEGKWRDYFKREIGNKICSQLKAWKKEIGILKGAGGNVDFSVPLGTYKKCTDLFKNEEGVYDYRIIEKASAYILLGKIIHLFQDLSIPAHSHLDDHPGVTNQGRIDSVPSLARNTFTSDEGFEEWSDNRGGWRNFRWTDSTKGQGQVKNWDIIRVDDDLISLTKKKIPFEDYEVKSDRNLYYFFYKLNTLTRNLASDNINADGSDRRGLVPEIEDYDDTLPLLSDDLSGGFKYDYLSMGYAGIDFLFGGVTEAQFDNATLRTLGVDSGFFIKLGLDVVSVGVTAASPFEEDYGRCRTPAQFIVQFLLGWAADEICDRIIEEAVTAALGGIPYIGSLIGWAAGPACSVIANSLIDRETQIEWDNRNKIHGLGNRCIEATGRKFGYTDIQDQNHEFMIRGSGSIIVEFFKHVTTENDPIQFSKEGGIYSGDDFGNPATNGLDVTFRRIEDSDIPAIFRESTTYRVLYTTNGTDPETSSSAQEVFLDTNNDSVDIRLPEGIHDVQLKVYSKHILDDFEASTNFAFLYLDRHVYHVGGPNSVMRKASLETLPSFEEVDWEEYGDTYYDDIERYKHPAGTYILDMDEPGTVFFTVDGSDPFDTTNPNRLSAVNQAVIVLDYPALIKFYTVDVGGLAEANPLAIYNLDQKTNLLNLYPSLDDELDKSGLSYQYIVSQPGINVVPFFIDDVTPTTYVTPPPGRYTSALNIRLISDENSSIYFTQGTVGVPPSDPVLSDGYSDPFLMNGSGDTLIKYFSEDDAGNQESIQQSIYEIVTAPTLTGTYSFGGMINSITAGTSDTAYFIDYALGKVIIIDVSTPGSPAYGDEITIPAFVTDIEVNPATGNLYLAQMDETRIYDNSLVSPSLLATIPADEVTRIDQIKVSGNYLFVAEDAKVKVYDISTPSSPTGQCGTPCTYDNGSVIEDIYYENNMLFVQSNGLLRILDFDGTNFTELSNYVFYGIEDLTAFSDRLYIVRSGTLIIFDISDLATTIYPAMTGLLDLPGELRTVDVKNGYAFISGGYEGILVVNVSNDSAPYHAHTIDRDGYLNHAAIWAHSNTNDYIHLTNSNYGLDIIDVTVFSQ